MSMIGNEFKCDGCDRDLENGSLLHCALVARLIVEQGLVENLHFCVDYEQDGNTVKGCASKMLTPTRMAAYRERSA